MLQHIAKAQAVAKEQGNSYCNDWAEQCKHLWMEEAQPMDAASVDKFPILIWDYFYFICKLLCILNIS